MKNQNHTSHFTHRTSQKGITLIALIITIIVMLILVGVTINVALNGGLFQKAEQAKTETQLAADKEELQLEIITAYDEKTGEVNLSTLKTNLTAKGWNVTVSEETAICTSPNGNTFTVTADGKTSEGGTHSGGNGSTAAEDLELLRKYFYSAETVFDRLTSPTTPQELVTAAPSDIIFKDDPQTITDASTSIVVTSTMQEGQQYITYIKYKNNMYIGKTGVSDFKCNYVDIAIENAGNLGKYVQYDGKLWIVLYDEGEYGEGAQLISADTLEVDSVYLGYSDSIINWSDSEVIAEANKFSTDNPSETEVLSDVEKAIYSYNHAIENLNTKCASLITDNSKITAVRSVGSNQSSPNSEAGDCSLEILKTYPQSDTKYIAGTFNGIGKNTDENYLTDYERMGILGISKSDNSGYYWLASRLVEEYSDHVDFRVRTVDTSGFLEDDYLWDVKSSQYIHYCGNHGVRPVISLKAGVLKEAIESDSTKDGSRLNAYVID